MAIKSELVTPFPERIVRIGEQFLLIDPKDPKFQASRFLSGDTDSTDSVLYTSSINLHLPRHRPVPFKIVLEDSFPKIPKETQLDLGDIENDAKPGLPRLIAFGLETEDTQILQRRKLAGKKGVIKGTILSQLQEICLMVTFPGGHVEVLKPVLDSLSKIIYDCDAFNASFLSAGENPFADLNLGKIQQIKATFIPRE